MNNTNQHVHPAELNKDMTAAEQENEVIKSEKRGFRHALVDSGLKNMTEAEIEALYHECTSVLAQNQDLFKKIKARSLATNGVFYHYKRHTYRFAQLRARTPALQDLNLLSTEAIDNWSNILEHDRKAREAKWELYRRCKEEAEYEASWKKLLAFTRKHLVFSRRCAKASRALEQSIKNNKAYWDVRITLLSVIQKKALDRYPVM
ncbi:hypothetical protein D6D13_08775 [Aureobasidium pullulans]|uniref:Uncharacterized protein n=1 Tax=Aureobasidium pullulans TaxID=5580 RepID=A0A4V4IYM3_AURPU|nr:hypothetical protein D6D13_08775 [Aureobasidium pullulans]